MKKSISFLLLANLIQMCTVFAQTTTPILTLNTEMHSAVIRKIRVDAAGKLILTTSWDKTAKLWDAETGSLIRTFHIPMDAGNEGSLNAGAISPDGALIAIGGWTGYTWDKSVSVYLLDTKTGTMIKRLKGLPESIRDIEFSPDGLFLAVAMGSDKGVRIYKCSSWDLHKVLTDYSDHCTSISFDQSGRMATACYDGKIRLYSRLFAPLKEIRTSKEKYPNCVAFSPDGSLLAVAYRDAGQIQVFNGTNLKLSFEPDITGTNLDGQSLALAAFSGDGSQLLAGYSYSKKIDGRIWCQIRIWDNKGEGTFRDYPAAQAGVMDICPIPGQSFLWAGGTPDFGRINTDGTPVFKKDPVTNYFWGKKMNWNIQDAAHFRINKNGTVIGITPTDKTPITFSVDTRTFAPLKYEDGTSPTDHQANIKISNWTGSNETKINGKKVTFLADNERSCSVDLSNDGKNIVLGGDFNIYCLTPDGEKRWDIPAYAGTIYVNITDDGKTLVSVGGDGIIRWHSMTNGKILFSLFLHSDNKRWVLWSPDGYFDCSQGADDLIGWHVNQGPAKEALYYPASQFFEKFFVPNLGARLLAGEKITASDVSITSFKLPPLVKITSPNSDVRGFKPVNSIIQSELATIEVTSEVTDQGGGIDEILIYNNGKLVQTTGKSFKNGEQKGAKSTKTFTINLSNGENKIRVTAFNPQRTESIADELSITYTGKEAAKPNLWLFVIGINQYKNAKYNLNFAVADAQGFKQQLEQGGSGIFSGIRTVFLTNAEATKPRILQEFSNIKAAAKQEDVFLFYYAGHGVMSEEQIPQFFIIPYDVTQLYGNEQVLKKNGISASELKFLSTEIKAQKQMFVLDACQSGGMTGMLAARGAAEEKAVSQLARSTGTYWLAASNSEQFASEFTQLGHGVFTYCILEGLSGKADGQSDKKITVQELSTYLQDQVPVYSTQYRGSAQYPNTYGYGQDFPIIMVK